MKSCITCKIDKPLTDYHKRKSSKDGLQHKCKSCVKEWDTIYKSRNKQHTKQYDKANEERFAENRKKTLNRKNNSIKAGVYSIYKGDEVIYVGESKRPYTRKGHHFSINGKKGGNTTTSPVAWALTNKELQRENLIFRMLEYVEDLETRLEREKYFIDIYNPIYNTYNQHTIWQVKN